MTPGEARPFPWDAILAFALGRLRWTPTAFWQATPREIASAIEGATGRSRADTLTRHHLVALMAAFPDTYEATS